MNPLTEKPEHGAPIGGVNGNLVYPSNALQLYHDALTLVLNANLLGGFLKLATYTVATVPSASESGAGAVIYVTDETGGAVMAASDGTDWRRTTDNAVIS